MRVGLFLLLLSWSASAQTFPSEPTCGVCAAGARCISGACQFSCTQDADCRGGNVCVGAQCEPRLPLRRAGAPPTIRRGDATHPERFKAIDPVPPGFHLAREPSWEALARGSIAFASAWLPMAIAAGTTGTTVLAIPVAGPVLGYRPDREPLRNFAVVTAIAIDASVQLFGLVTAILGFVLPSQWLERDAPVSFAPTASGARVVGHF
jgi:hypothetical protein